MTQPLRLPGACAIIHGPSQVLSGNPTRLRGVISGLVQVCRRVGLTALFLKGKLPGAGGCRARTAIELAFPLRYTGSAELRGERAHPKRRTTHLSDNLAPCRTWALETCRCHRPLTPWPTSSPRPATSR